MAYIQPNSAIEFFGDLGLSNNYDDTLYFSSVSAKDNYFSSITKIASVQSCTYSRETRGYVRVELPMSTLINASYMRFKNTSFENKWFYAFIRNVEYVNNGCTQINFELDVIMTWMGSFSLGQCFVERQHVANDTIGANICDEGLETGDYVYENVIPTGYFNDTSEYWVSVSSTLSEDGSSEWDRSTITDGVYCGARTRFYNIHASTDPIDEFFKNASENELENSIASVSMYPSVFLTSGTTTKSGLTVTPVSKPYNNISGYVPKNNKLFTYPYNYLEVTNTEGNYKDFKYEFFDTVSVCNFQVYCTVKSPIEAVLVPRNYKGQTENINEAISMTDFPMCSYINDTFKAYLAQRKSNAVTGALLGGFSGGVIGGAGGAIAGAIVGGLRRSGIVSDISNLLTRGTEQVGKGATQVGSPSSDCIYAIDKKDFYFIKKQITANYASMIDDYFTMFGYAIRNVRTPNMNVRPHWTYVKTIGCVVHGNLPADDMGAIENIFNKGVRFWKNHNEIGNFNLDNSPA